MHPLTDFEVPADREAAAAQWEGWDTDRLCTCRLAKRVINEPSNSSDKPMPGDHVKVHYTGWLRGGKCFDSSRDKRKPFSLTLGEGSVIEGWEKGLLHVGLGERAWLLIAPEWAYAEHGYADARGEHIPPDSALLFDIELLAINGRKVPGAMTPATSPALTDEQQAELEDSFLPASFGAGSGSTGGSSKTNNSSKKKKKNKKKKR